MKLGGTQALRGNTMVWNHWLCWPDVSRGVDLSQCKFWVSGKNVSWFGRMPERMYPGVSQYVNFQCDDDGCGWVASALPSPRLCLCDSTERTSRGDSEEEVSVCDDVLLSALPTYKHACGIAQRNQTALYITANHYKMVVMWGVCIMWVKEEACVIQCCPSTGREVWMEIALPWAVFVFM